MVNRINKAQQNHIDNGDAPLHYARRACTHTQNTRSVASNPEKQLIRRLQAVDFSLYDTILYLDAYPECKKAMARYQHLLRERETIVTQLSEINIPISNMRNNSDSWNWIDSPWPWELDANT